MQEQVTITSGLVRDIDAIGYDERFLDLAK